MRTTWIILIFAAVGLFVASASVTATTAPTNNVTTCSHPNASTELPPLEDEWVKTPVPQTSRACQWYDPGGYPIGLYVTYYPPDTPASGGYKCEGYCTNPSDNRCGSYYTITYPDGLVAANCQCYFGDY